MDSEGQLLVSRGENDNRRGCSGEREFGGIGRYWGRCSGVVWNVRAAADAMGSCVVVMGPAALGRGMGRDMLVGL